MAFNLADYEPVEDRLARFWEDYPNGRVFTEIAKHDNEQVIIKTYLFKNIDDQWPCATGFAEERKTERGINATSWVEVCETSSIGRALANAGYAAKGKRPSREEMAKASRQVAAPLTEEQTQLKALLAKKFQDGKDRKTYIESVVFRDVEGVSSLSPDEVKLCIESLEKETA